MDYAREELRAFVGPNADYYLWTWGRIDPTGGPQALRWNWPAFLVTLFWLLYRRMYRYFWMAAGVLFLLGPGNAIAEVRLHFTSPAWLDLILEIAFVGFFGAYGNWLYYRHAVAAIGRAKAHDVSPQTIANAGGVRWWPAILFAALITMVFLILLLASAAQE